MGREFQRPIVFFGVRDNDTNFFRNLHCEIVGFLYWENLKWGKFSEIHDKAYYRQNELPKGRNKTNKFGSILWKAQDGFSPTPRLYI